MEVGTEAVKKLNGKHACLLANHGVLAVGANLDQAHIRAVYVEDAAKIYSLALSSGDVKVIEQKHVEQMKGRR